LHLVGILFPYINDDARSKSHQIIIQLVNFQLFTPQDQFPAHNITSTDPILCQWNSATQPRSLLI